MRRHTIAPRPNWQGRVEESGLTWHGDGSYWNESAFWELSAAEVDQIEAATNELHQRCIDAAGHIIDNKRYAEFGIPAAAIPLIEWSWQQEPPSIYGRFDLAFDGMSPPRLLEYNADTPTCLLETAVTQWNWLEDKFPARDQFNSIHESLIAHWKEMKPWLNGTFVHCASMDDMEDGTTVTYLLDTLVQAGLEGGNLPIGEIGWHRDLQIFVDSLNVPIKTIFKLYPWENMVREPFFENLWPTRESTMWIEPAWKLLLSGKGILAALWELFPGHPNLLPAYMNSPRFHIVDNCVSKPVFGRQGEGIKVKAGGQTHDDGLVIEGPRVFQQFHETKQPDGIRPTIGSWIIGQAAHGMGIRETDGLVAGNLSRFTPHLFG